MKNILLLRWFLFLVALHSFIVGINLILFPTEWMTEFGFAQISEQFFKIQGGVFHIVMAVAYTLAGWRPKEYKVLIIFSITAKFMATVFLFSYFFFVNSLITVLLSGIVDFFMGLILVYFLRNSDLS